MTTKPVVGIPHFLNSPPFSFRNVLFDRFLFHLSPPLPLCISAFNTVLCHCHLYHPHDVQHATHHLASESSLIFESSTFTATTANNHQLAPADSPTLYSYPVYPPHSRSTTLPCCNSETSRPNRSPLFSSLQARHYCLISSNSRLSFSDWPVDRKAHLTTSTSRSTLTYLLSSVLLIFSLTLTGTQGFSSSNQSPLSFLSRLTLS